MPFIAIGPYCWGLAQTTGDAVRRMKRARPDFLKGPVEYDVYNVASDAWVDDTGNIRSAEAPVKLKQVRFIGGQRIVKEKFDAPLPKLQP